MGTTQVKVWLTLDQVMALGKLKDERAVTFSQLFRDVVDFYLEANNDTN